MVIKFIIMVFADIIYADVSKWGRLRALPVADKASNKEWPRSKLIGATSRNKFRVTATGHNGAPRSMKIKLLVILLNEFNIYADVSKWS